MNALLKNGVILFFFLFAPVIAPTHDLETMFNDAVNLYMRGKVEESIAAYKNLLKHHPNCLTAYYNLGFILRKAGYVRQAIPKLKLVTMLDAEFTKAHISLGQAYLTIGKYLEGWKELEWRLGRPPEPVQELKHYLQKHGNLYAKVVLIRSEWGLGDTLQMIRYAKKFKELDAIVVALVRTPLVNILSHCPYIDKVIGPNYRLPPFHFEVPTMSLPVVFETTLQTVPNEIPYLKADPQLVSTWKEKLGPHNKFRIGICWQGNHVHVNTKFMPLNRFMELAEFEEVQLYSLQQQHGLEQLEGVPENQLIRFDQDFDKTHGSFMDTAAVMNHLDLVITIDTSIAHLAGGLGIPTWVVLPRLADWRWMLERNDSPWYPNVHLFRQTKDGNWDDVIQHIKSGVKQLLNQQSRRG
ncbi:hypothetical protein ACFLX2_01270 [Candidatus Dependentiae bacterium]